jgi:hypothetical protein
LKIKRPREQRGALAVWKAKHTELLHGIVTRLKGEGWSVDVERYWRVTGTTAIIAGKADCICQAKARRPLIVDAKGGEPRDSDVAQVLIEMVMVPLAWDRPTMVFDGLVLYEDHPPVAVTPAQADVFRPRVMATLRQLGSPERPDARPGRDSCRFCDVPDSECSVRYTEESTAHTSEF